MRAAWDIQGTTLRLNIRLDSGEDTTGGGQNDSQVNLLTNSCRVELPVGLGEIHPDLLALAALTIVTPWVRNRLELSAPVSPEFAETVSKKFRFEIGPVDNSLKPREHGPVTALSFSGGADSVTVSQLLPDNAPHIHFRRVPHPRIPDRANHVRSGVIEELVRQMGSRGLDISVVSSDLEYLVGPFPMYPQWTTLAIGSILLADHLKLGATAIGTILPERYLRGGRCFDTRPVEGVWNLAFDAVGIAMLRPVCGISEVLTFRISDSSPVGDLARSCIQGDIHGPCMACMKCLRKELLRSAAENKPLNPTLLWRLERQPKVIERFMAEHCVFQHILEYALVRIPEVEKTFLADIKEAVDPDPRSTEWLERCYEPSIAENVPENWQSYVRERILEHCQFMTPEDEEKLRNYTPTFEKPGDVRIRTQSTPEGA